MAICCDFVTAPYAVPKFLRSSYSLTTAYRAGKNPVDSHGTAATMMSAASTAAMYGKTLPIASSGDTLPIAQAA